jgi:hypothetical protein
MEWVQREGPMKNYHVLTTITCMFAAIKFLCQNLKGISVTLFSTIK